MSGAVRESPDNAAAIARLQRPSMHIDLLASAAINGMVVQASRRENGPPQGIPETVTGGVPQFYRRPDEPIDQVPERYRNWLSDKEWREGCEAAMAAVAEGRDKMVTVAGSEVGL